MRWRAAVVFDIDNTLFNFVDTFAPAFRAMVAAVVARTGLDQGTVLSSFRDVFASFGSLEYPEAVGDLAILKDWSVDSRAEFSKKALTLFDRRRGQLMEPYPGTTTTLRWLVSQGYLLIAYTDGAANQSTAKLQRLGLSQYFTALAAWGPDTADLSIDVSSLQAPEWQVITGRRQFQKVRTWKLPRASLKPNPALLAAILSEVGAIPDRSWLVGDSLEKDLMPARRAGINEVWARYGKTFSPDNWATLVSVSPWPSSAVHSEKGARPTFEPAFVVDNFEDIMRVIPPLQFGLFAFR